MSRITCRGIPLLSGFSLFEIATNLAPIASGHHDTTIQIAIHKLRTERFFSYWIIATILQQDYYRPYHARTPCSCNAPTATCRTSSAVLHYPHMLQCAQTTQHQARASHARVQFCSYHHTHPSAWQLA
ncbi:hypothetical protein F4677DRAFT_324105 [Hypoxylon crocopeplum]|nr:hypothetical protein F4677DRAFT_324105 [Hypoxylon crocopeplum]